MYCYAWWLVLLLAHCWDYCLPRKKAHIREKK